MVPLARRSLVADRFRVFLSVAGVALSIMLILVLQGLFSGINAQITAYLDNSPADLVVAERGLRNFLGARSLVPAATLDRIAADPDIGSTTPVIVQYVVLELGGRREFMLLVGFDEEIGGGPWEMEEGRAEPSDDELVLDEVTASRHDLGPGSEVDVLGRTLTVAGMSGGTSSWMTGTLFVSFDTASALLGTGGAPSFGLLTVAEGSDPPSVARRLEDTTGLSVTEREAMNANDVRLYAAVLNGPLALMVGIAFLVGVSLVGLTIHAATVERSKEYGALKAIGIGNRTLFAVVLKQTGMATVAGLVVGVGLAFVAKAALESLAPQFLVDITGTSVASAVVAAVAMSLVAATLPVRALAKIDPLVAFRKGV